MNKRKKILIVLGMHRSGTSALAGLLSHLSIPMGDNLMTPVEGENDKGFFEDEEIVELNDQLLSKLGMSWDDARLMPDKWWMQDDVNEIKIEIKILAKASAAEKNLSFL